MELKFLGKGSAFNPTMKNTSAYFMMDKNLFLIDCGESVFEILFQSSVLEACNDIYIMLTHLHSDHVGSLGSIISYCYCVQNKMINIVHPEETVVELLDLLGIKRKFYKYHKALPQDIEGIKIESIEVKHVPDMTCYGYILEVEGSRIYYSGDAEEIPESVLAQLKSGVIDRIYQDTSCHLNDSHLYVDNLKEVIPLKIRNKVFCMHIDSDCEERLKENGFQIVQVYCEE